MLQKETCAGYGISWKARCLFCSSEGKGDSKSLVFDGWPGGTVEGVLSKGTSFATTEGLQDVNDGISEETAIDGHLTEYLMAGRTLLWTRFHRHD